MALPKALTDIPVDNDYSLDDAAIVESLISSGQLSTKQVSDYFNLPVADINRVLEKDFEYTPQQSALAGVAPDLDYSMEDARIVEEALRSGVVTAQDVADYYKVPVEDVNKVLTKDFNYTPDQLAAVQRREQEKTKVSIEKGTGSTTTGGSATGGLTARTYTDQTQNVFSPMGQQGVGQDLTDVMGGQQGYTGGTLQNGNIRYNDPNVIGGQVNMPQVGVIGAESALQGGLAGGLAGLQQGIGEARTGLVGSSQEAINQLQSGLSTGATGLTQATASGLQELRRALGQGRQDITAGYGRAEQGFQPYMQGGEAAQAQLEALSGARGQEAFQQAYQESPYIQFLREQGMRANLAGAAATGGLGGGNVQKELARFGQGLASQGIQQQIQNLQGLTGQGLQAAQGAGQYAAGGAGQLAGLEQTQGTQALGAMQNVGQGLANLGQVAGTQGAGIMQNVGQQLANLGLAGGQTAAQMGYGTGQSLADIRTRAGELMAGEISNVSRDTANLAQALGGNISNVYGTQAQNIAQLLVNSGMSQADAAQQTAQMLANIAVGAGGQVAGLGTGVGQPQIREGLINGQAVGTALATFSDARLKNNITKIGITKSGTNLYSWDWKPDAPAKAKQQAPYGVIAQEIMQSNPEAVTEIDGYLAVDYSKVH